jgi:hypothetical protein
MKLVVLLIALMFFTSLQAQWDGPLKNDSIKVGTKPIATYNNQQKNPLVYISVKDTGTYITDSLSTYVVINSGIDTVLVGVIKTSTWTGQEYMIGANTKTMYLVNFASPDMVLVKRRNIIVSTACRTDFIFLGRKGQ